MVSSRASTKWRLLANLPDLQHQHTILRDGCCDGYPLAQLLDLRVDVSAVARVCRFQGTLTDPERFDSPEIVLEKHDFSYSDCTQSFFLLLRRRRRRYTAACRAAEHHGSIHRCCTHTTARATRFLPRTTRHQYSHARLHAKLHTRRVRPSSAAVRCSTTTPSASCRAEGSCVCTQRLD